MGVNILLMISFKLAAKTQNSPTDDIPTLNVGSNSH